MKHHKLYFTTWNSTFNLKNRSYKGFSANFLMVIHLSILDMIYYFPRTNKKNFINNDSASRVTTIVPCIHQSIPCVVPLWPRVAAFYNTFVSQRADVPYFTNRLVFRKILRNISKAHDISKVGVNRCQHITTSVISTLPL